jgi:hypothetical protein
MSSDNDASDIGDEMNEESTSSQSVEKCNYCEVFKTLLLDMPYSITIILIVSFFAAFIIVMAYNPDLFRDISAIWGAWIGTAIGYFFGSRPVETLSKRIEQVLDDLDDSSERNETIIDAYESELEASRELITKYKEDFEDAKNTLQYITVKYSQNFDTDLLTRLKNKYGVIP